MSGDFSNNPFAVLQSKSLPKSKKSKSITSAQSVQASVQESKKSISSEEIDDSQLFLQSVQNATKSTKQANRINQLSENEDFAKLSKKGLKNASKTKQIHAKPQENPKQVNPDFSTMPTKLPKPLALEVVEDDEQNFLKAMQEVAPLNTKGRDIAPEVKPLAPAINKELSFEGLMESKVEFALALKGEYLEGHVMGLDELTMNSLRAGNYSPEAHIDLHGLNAMQAYQALVGFFRGSWYKGLRTVLVVPGRGKNSINGFAVLRDKLQTWLTQEPFKRVVLAFCTAKPVDGGPGSVYVLLRKYKKKGKIHWERMPSDPDLF